MTDYERVLREVLAELLQTGPRQLGLDDTFAELGVDSLTGLRLVRRIRDVTAREIELEALFEFPTIHELARFLERQAGDRDMRQDGHKA